MTTEYLCQYIWRSISGLPEDHCVNTFHFQGPDATTDPDAVTAIGGALHTAFHTNVGTRNGDNVGSFIGNSVSRTNKPIARVYRRLEGDPPALWGAPIGESLPAAFSAAGTLNDLPREVAICASYHGILDVLPERVPAGPEGPEGDLMLRSRHRGRAFMGPWATSVLTAGTTGRPTGAIRDVLADAFEYLLTAPALVAAGITWRVHSRVDNAMYLVTGGWIDDEFDTQRRRGNERTTRLIWGTGL